MKKTTLFVLLAWGILGANAGAEIVNASFTGSFEAAGRRFEPIFAGTTIRGELTYNTQSAGGSNLGVFPAALTDFQVEVLGAADPFAYVAPGGVMTVVNLDASGDDLFKVLSRTADGLTGDTVLGDQITAMSLELRDTDATVVDSGDTPLSLSIGNFEETRVELSNSLGNVIYTLDTLSSVVVPLPASGWLLLTVAAVLCGGKQASRLKRPARFRSFRPVPDDLSVG